MPPPAPPEFEVATVKPSAPQVRKTRFEVNGDEIQFHGASMQTLVTYAWNIDPATLVGAPAWFGQQRWDILGKATTDSSPKGRPVDEDDLKVMLRLLLADRFKLKTHTEEQPGDAYTLVAARPKLKKANPDVRTSCHDGPGQDGKDPRIANPILGRLVTCVNISMAEFAEQLESLAPDYIKTPVLDATGIKGSYDLTLNFSYERDFRTGGVGSGAAAAASAAAAAESGDPSGAISLFDALNKQLGLKLMTQKRPTPMLVIDHVEQPSAN
jgi:uncharacterized protein (TIGR03435 family)